MLARTQQCVWWMAVELPKQLLQFLQLLLQLRLPLRLDFIPFVDLHVWTEKQETTNPKQRNELLKWQFKWLSTWSADRGSPAEGRRLFARCQDKSSKANTFPSKMPKEPNTRIARNIQTTQKEQPRQQMNNNNKGLSFETRWSTHSYEIFTLKIMELKAKWSSHFFPSNKINLYNSHIRTKGIKAIPQTIDK